MHKTKPFKLEDMSKAGLLGIAKHLKPAPEERDLIAFESNATLEQYKKLVSQYNKSQETLVSIAESLSKLTAGGRACKQKEKEGKAALKHHQSVASSIEATKGKMDRLVKRMEALNA